MDELGELGLDWSGSRCSSCEEEKVDLNWCRPCNAERFQQDFKNWTSGNSNIDEFIQESQKSADNDSDVLEWVPFERFQDIEYIAEGGFGKVYKARWIDGLIHSWDDKAQNWERIRQNTVVALKSLNDSKDISADTVKVISEISYHKDLGSAPIIRSYGITQEPNTKNYMMILEYAEDGSLRHYLDESQDLSWRDKIRTIYNIALGLDKIHEKGIIHRDLHEGNILMHNNQACITDMGLCKPVSNTSEDKIYGVIYYIAPELLQQKGYTKASDIYSFGILMCRIISGLPPYYGVPEDKFFGLNVCKGLRPKFYIEVPQLVSDLIYKCLDGDPENRPKAREIKDKLCMWWKEIEDNLNNPLNQSLLNQQIKKTDKINLTSTNVKVPNIQSKKMCSKEIQPSKHSNRSHKISKTAEFDIDDDMFNQD